MVNELAGRTALVTGGGTGIGFACAQELLRAGAIVTIAGRRAEVLEEAAGRLRAAVSGGQVRTAACDVIDEQAITAAVGRAAGEGDLAAAVVNAGTGTGRPVLLMSADELRALLEVNVVGAFNTLRAAAEAMRGQGGSIIAISSIAAALGGRFRSAYAASKAALDMLVRCAADELGPLGIRVNSVRPGLVPSEVTDPLTSAAGDSPLARVRADYIAQMPLGRLGTADEVARLVRFLAGPDAAWITGQHYAIDGGHTLRRAPNMEAGVRAAMGDEQVDALVGPRW